MSSFVERMRSNPKSICVPVLAIAAVAAVGGAVVLTSRYLQADHVRTVCKRAAQKKYRALLGDLAECKGILNYIDSQEIPKAQQLATEVEQIMSQIAQGGANEAEQAALQTRLQAIRMDIMGVGEQLLRLMEKVDGVAPALVLEAAGLEPWAEHEKELKDKALSDGLGAVFDLASDLRAIRKGLIHKAERRARKVDSLKKITAVAV